MNKRRRLIARVCRKNPILLKDDFLFLYDNSNMLVVDDSIIKINQECVEALRKFGLTALAAAHTFDWRDIFQQCTS